MNRQLPEWMQSNGTGLPFLFKKVKTILGSSFCCAVLIVLVFSVPSLAATELKGSPDQLPGVLDRAGVKENLGQTIALDRWEFISSVTGQTQTLAPIFASGRPVIVNLVYYECPMLCTLVLNGMLTGLKGLDWEIGKQFEMVTISIDPGETVDTAEKKRQVYIEDYVSGKISPSKDSKDLANAGWHFFTAKEDQVRGLADQLGFSYAYDPQTDEYGHPAVSFVLTSTGKISRYLYGIEYRPRDLRLALLEASQGKVGNVIDRFLMFCYHYDAEARGYALHAVRLMQAAAAFTVAMLGGYLALFWIRQRKKERTV